MGGGAPSWQRQTVGSCCGGRRELDQPLAACELINASDRKISTKFTYIQHADGFVRWLAGEVDL